MDLPCQYSIILQTLQDAAGDALCERCLTAICGLLADEIQIGIATFLNDPDQFERAWGCASCHRDVASIVYRAKCSHCSQRFQRGEKAFRMGEEMFHVACLHRLIADDTIRLSRTLGRRSRRLIEQSRRRMRQGGGWPPLESP